MNKDTQESQVDTCYQVLRNLIITCEFEPGMRLTERELIARLGVGRTPVREALLRLDQDRLIDTLPRSGYRVRALSRKSIIDFYAVWSVIAPLIASLAIRKMTPEQRERLSELGRERWGVEVADPAAQARVAQAFFDFLVEVADNEPLTHICSRLGAEMERIFLLFFGTPEGRAWMGPPNEIETFARVTDPELAAKRIQARVIASEQGVLAVLDARLRGGANPWPFTIDQVDAA